jgi:hypothetical protein
MSPHASVGDHLLSVVSEGNKRTLRAVMTSRGYNGRDGRDGEFEEGLWDH